MSQKTEIVASWEKDPDQGFTTAEKQILIEAGCVQSSVHNILAS